MKRGIIVLALVLALSGCGTNGNIKEPENGTETVGANTEVTLYISNENGDGFVEKEAKLEELTPEAILLALAEERVVPLEAKVLSFSQDGNTLTLDLSREYQENVMSFGTSGELITIGGVVNTFLKAYDADTITILVEGKTWDSGHAEIDGPLSWYES